MDVQQTDSPASADVPSMLDLIRLSPRTLFPPGGRELYRQVALLTEMGEGDEILVAACGIGVTAEFFVREYGVQGSGVDEDPFLVDRAEGRVRADGLRDRLQFQHGSMASLPYRDGVFDVVVAELGLTARVDPQVAVRELVRVTRPGGQVVLVQLVWKAPVEPERQVTLARHLGARPLMLVELKRILREAGVERLHSEAWSDENTAFRPHVVKPFPDFAELFSLPEKLRILRRAWGRWGWRGVQTALRRETEVHRLLTRERILGLDMVKGRKMAMAEHEGQAQVAESSDVGKGQEEVNGLPLFHEGGAP
ncbi:MAG: methyltransferase domain-containing protein [Gemmatimonadota bacterium]